MSGEQASLIDPCVFVRVSIECLLFYAYSHFLAHRYAKIKDINNWLVIDEKTADIRLAKLPDRESKYLINGTYYAEIICITSGKYCMYARYH